MILKEQKPWDKLTFREKLLFFDLFLPARILGNSFQILGSGLILTQGFSRIGNLANYDEVFVGKKNEIDYFRPWRLICLV